MSADNWAICPRCVYNARKEAEERFEAARAAYGNVPAAEYEALRAAAQVPVDPESFDTFREDYEIYGAEDGTITVTYSGSCNTCGLGLHFRIEKPFYDRETGEPSVG